MRNLIAQKEIDLGTLEAPNIGPLGDVGESAERAGDLFNQIIASSVGLITLIAAIWFVFLIITGAYGIMSAGGDKTSIEGARTKITNGIIGFVVVIAGIFIVELIGSLLGYDLILNPAQLILELGFGN